MQRGIGYRLYPTKEQALFLTRNAGCCRKAYNECLSFRKLAYDADGTSLSDTELVGIITVGFIWQRHEEEVYEKKVKELKTRENRINKEENHGY